MNWEGIIIGISTFLIIGLFHPVCIKSEYRWGTKCWWAFLVLSLAGITAALLVENLLFSALLSVFAFSSMWTILELFEQRERVNKGWFPANPKRKNEYSIRCYSYKYPHPAVTADCVIFEAAGAQAGNGGFDSGKVRVLLIERGAEPYKGQFAFPGGFMQIDESAEECAARELMEETGIGPVTLHHLTTCSDVNRDPRERVVSVVFCAIVAPGEFTPAGGDDARRAVWVPLNEVGSLAFDHNAILKKAEIWLKTMTVS